jgi:DNA-binding response OmpR family regulator
MYARLIALDDQDVAQSEYILNKEIHLIGRLAQSCDILVNRPSVSRIHARIEQQAQYYYLENLSRQNTYLNGQPIKEKQILTHNDTIGLDKPTPTFKFVEPDSTAIIIRPIRYDERAMKIHLAEKTIYLTPLENRLFSHLYEHAGQIRTHKECEQAIWNYDQLDSTALHRLVGNIRDKLRQLDPTKEFIKNERGKGYILDL